MDLFSLSDVFTSVSGPDISVGDSCKTSFLSKASEKVTSEIRIGCTGKQRNTTPKDGVSLGDESALHFTATSTKVAALRPARTLKNSGGSGLGYGKLGSGGGLVVLVAWIILADFRAIDLAVA